MKKIVALVLCLALALSLCTVAFAVNVELNGKEVDADHKGAKASNIEKEKLGNLEYWYIDGAYYVESDVTTASDTLTYSGKDLPVVKANPFYLTKAVTFTKVDEDKHDYIDDAADTDNVYVAFENKDGDVKYYQVEDADENTASDEQVLVDGELKALADKEAEFVGHDFELVDTTKDPKAGAKVKCDCGVTGVLYTNANAVADGYKYEEFEDGFIAVFKDVNYTISGSTTETVESAKTFDAGIALYAGMALASVAGSAVVIGKKKEF